MENKIIKGNEENKNVFSLKYLIKTTRKDDEWLDKEFGKARRFQIACIKEVNKRLRVYYNHPVKKELFELYPKNNCRFTAGQSNQLKKIRSEIGLDKKGIYDDYTKEYRKIHHDALTAVTARSIADNIVTTMDKYLYPKKGSKTNPKNEFLSISKELLTLSDGNGGAKCIRYRDGYVCYSELKAKLHIDKKDYYKQEALKLPIRSSAIKRVKNKNGQYSYYLILVFEGKPTDVPCNRISPVKHKCGPIGVDIGLSTVAVSNADGDLILEELGEGVRRIESKANALRRKIDRQRRANNPDNFNVNGTVKKGVYVFNGVRKVKQRLTWNDSKGCKKNWNELAYLTSKRAVSLKQSQEKLAKRIVQMGDICYIEDMDFKSLQEKSKKTEISEKTGRQKSKKRFGKLIGTYAPAQFVNILEKKCYYHGKDFIKVNTYQTKASQYNHITGECVKKSLNERYGVLDESNKIVVQRDLYSAFLMMNCKDQSSIDQERCKETFKIFKEAHDNKIRELSLKRETIKLPSSMGLDSAALLTM